MPLGTMAVPAQEEGTVRTATASAGTPGSSAPGFARALRLAALMLAAALVYLALAWLSTHTAPRLGDIAYLWLAGGFALGVLLICRAEQWPWLLGALLAADLLHAELLTAEARASISYAFMYFTCLAAASLVLRRYLGVPARLDTVRKVLLFVAVGPGVLNLAAAVLGAAVTAALQQQSFPKTVQIWWISDTLGLLLMTPLVLALAHGSRLSRGDWSPSRVVEALLAFLGLAVTAQLAFGVEPRASGAVAPLQHFIAPFLIWIALRFGTRGATAALAVLTCVAVGNTELGTGPFSAAFGAAPEAVLQLQLYLAVVAAMTLLAAALMDERRASAVASDAWRLRYEAAAMSSGSVLYDMDLATNGVAWGVTRGPSSAAGPKLSEMPPTGCAACIPTTWSGSSVRFASGTRAPR